MLTPKPATQISRVRPGMPARRPPRGDEHHDERAERWRGPQHAEPDRPDVEDVAREDRQQRDGAAEEDREQVQCHRADERRASATT